MRTMLMLCGLALSAPAVAYDAAPPQSYAKPVGGGKFVLVMLQPEGHDFKPDLRKKYGKSGLYPADAPARPLWTCDWHAEYEANVAVSADGEWAVRVPDVETGLRHWLLGIENRPVPKPGAGWPNQPAVFVYRNGKLVHTLAVKDVFDTGRFSDRDLFMGPVIEIDSFDERPGRVWVRTTGDDGGTQTSAVAVRTGEVSRGVCGEYRMGFGSWLPRWAEVALIGGVVVVGGAAAVFALAAVLVRRQRKR